MEVSRAGRPEKEKKAFCLQEGEKILEHASCRRLWTNQRGPDGSKERRTLASKRKSDTSVMSESGLAGTNLARRTNS